jgi:hypothetical protein
MWPARKRPKGYARPKDYVPVPLNEHIALSQQPFWKDMPDILQAQVLVMIDMARRPKGSGWKTPKGEIETLLWAGTPHIRTKILLQIFAVWSVLLVIPSLILVEVVPDLGGWLALVWAVCSVFVFVPYISRGSREVYALTTHRAFSSCRTMFCSIQSEQVSYLNMGTVQLKLNVDHTGSFVLRSSIAQEFSEFPQAQYGAFHVPEVRFDHVFDVKGASKMLDAMLPEEVLEASGLAGASGK